ncbi:hypothetical protein CEE69_24115 [Rhodopirellula bahusiensis]|uniref:Uncharacterized protein n=1 Tax=Rhodopirellula bahusiensis TaxID=2014065 RepID=A0A2G1W1G1_9BACT|nr:hypothetical protein CEE69_24115 [Rhodopirellula bahusiensis]
MNSSACGVLADCRGGLCDQAIRRDAGHLGRPMQTSLLRFFSAAAVAMLLLDRTSVANEVDFASGFVHGLSVHGGTSDNHAKP